jgi:TolA-binding protein
MRIGTYPTMGFAVLVAAALASCAHEKRAREQTSQQAFEQAAQRQKELTEAQKRLDAAHRDAARAREQLAQAERREAQERTRVQQLQSQSRQDVARATELAQRQQAAAEQAQGLVTTAGRVAEATPSRVVVQTPQGRTMTFHVDQGTRVLVGAEQRSVAAIQQGADARVTYEPSGPEPTALTIEVRPAGSTAAPPAPAPQR